MRGKQKRKGQPKKRKKKEAQSELYKKIFTWPENHSRPAHYSWKKCTILCKTTVVYWPAPASDHCACWETRLWRRDCTLGMAGVSGLIICSLSRTHWRLGESKTTASPMLFTSSSSSFSNTKDWESMSYQNQTQLYIIAPIKNLHAFQWHKNNNYLCIFIPHTMHASTPTTPPPKHAAY